MGMLKGQMESVTSSAALRQLLSTPEAANINKWEAEITACDSNFNVDDEDDDVSTAFDEI